ncbi:hypothetical protein HERIO_1459 [Hepatospora eriocheir]|uniref:Uncharacterized protein n=1 Tax=Hepatospora eriocheir TaxID=1081669 RepID=A0A1X0QAB7_9MICR|nr:hypothetical protein HERIO_1459 [Hepatospora eriocheir]
MKEFDYRKVAWLFIEEGIKEELVEDFVKFENDFVFVNELYSYLKDKNNDLFRIYSKRLNKEILNVKFDKIDIKEDISRRRQKNKEFKKRSRKKNKIKQKAKLKACKIAKDRRDDNIKRKEQYEEVEKQIRKHYRL